LKFTEWVKAKGFVYKTAMEVNMDQLIEIAREERNHSEVEKLLTDLKRKIDTDKTSDLSRFKDEISKVLVQQIAFHYALAEGQAAVSLHRDPTVLLAKSLLSDQKQYRSILSSIQ
jgi:carboxyl-terminal processing protease